MANWHIEREWIEDGVKYELKKESGKHGRYSLTAWDAETNKHLAWRHYEWNVWLGHNCGLVGLIPDFKTRAKIALENERALTAAICT